MTCRVKSSRGEHCAAAKPDQHAGVVDHGDTGTYAVFPQLSRRHTNSVGEHLGVATKPHQVLEAKSAQLDTGVPVRRLGGIANLAWDKAADEAVEIPSRRPRRQPFTGDHFGQDARPVATTPPTGTSVPKSAAGV
jgi:hypothetical protein